MEMRWFGHAAHLCVGNMCRFHLATLLDNGYLVSTVGDYWPNLPWRKDAREPETIGLGRTYETMVFSTVGECPCGCGLPGIDAAEKDMRGYNDPKEATEGHMAMIREWEGKE